MVCGCRRPLETLAPSLFLSLSVLCDDKWEALKLCVCSFALPIDFVLSLYLDYRNHSIRIPAHTLRFKNTTARADKCAVGRLCVAAPAIIDARARELV